MNEEAEPVMGERLGGSQLMAWARAGNFAVDETTGNRMIQSLQGIVDSLTRRAHGLELLRQPSPLSTTATARWVSDHMVRTADDEQGLLTQLDIARQELPKVIEAIETAKRNYQVQDRETAHMVRSLGPEA